jgi:DsbC/DsbD-like thiol-disulfide interchange protein
MSETQQSGGTPTRETLSESRHVFTHMQRSVRGLRRMTLPAVGWSLLAAPLGASALPAPGPVGHDAEPNHVRIEVIADRESVAPGQAFWVAVVQHIDPGWHTYWLNPGDAGKATEIGWSTPSGYAVGTPDWPVPRVIRTGPVVSYGYEKEVVSLQQVRAPTTLAPGTVRLSAEVRWLACREMCIPEHAASAVALQQVSHAQGQASTGGRQRIDAARGLMPIAASWATTLTADAVGIRMRLHSVAGQLPAKGKLQFLPLRWGEIDNGAVQLAKWNGPDLVLSLVRGDLRDRPLTEIEGLLLVEQPGSQPLGYQLRASAGSDAGSH